MTKSSIASVIMPQSARAPETATSGTTRSHMSSTKPPWKQDSAVDRPADVWIPHGKDMIPETLDFAVTPCLRPATRNPGPTVPPTQNLAEYETPKRTFHDTANRCQWKRPPRHTVVFLDGHARGWGDTWTTWSPESPDPAPHLSAHQATWISNWLSASLRHSTARAMLRRARMPQGTTPTRLGPDDWWPPGFLFHTASWSLESG